MFHLGVDLNFCVVQAREALLKMILLIHANIRGMLSVVTDGTHGSLVLTYNKNCSR